jgi:hypothetical protein
MGKPSGIVADQMVSPRENPSRNATKVHDIACQNEKSNSEQGKRVDPSSHTGNYHDQGNLVEDHKHSGTDQHTEGDRGSYQEHEKESPE